MQTQPKQPATPGPEPAVRGSVAGVLVPLAGAVVELAVIGALFRFGLAQIWLCLGVHMAVVASLLLWLSRHTRSGGDHSLSTLLVLTLAAVGPAGPLITLLIAPFARAGADRSGLLEAWYERLAHSTAIEGSVQLAERVAAGRTLDLTRAASGSFLTVISHGTVLEQQAALGRIVRNFTPAYLPVLKIALKSPEPVIRVQAAAVATRIRPTIEAIMDRASSLADDDTATAETVLRATHDIQLILESGLLDVSDRAVALETRRRLDLHASTASATGLKHVLDTLRLTPFARLQREARLIETGEFKALRQLRRAGRVVLGRAYRLRRIPVARKPVT
jgi:hypothetical protein